MTHDRREPRDNGSTGELLPEPAPPDSRTTALSNMVLSASGWRAVFGGDDNSLSPAISPAHRDLIMVAARVFADLVRSAHSDRTRRPSIVVATDTRPTGPAIADTAIRTFLASSVDVKWLGVSAAPEVMSFTKVTDGCDAFFYISASHNPPGHNGLKLGLADGAVLPHTAATPLIARFRDLAVNAEFVHSLLTDVAALPPSMPEAVYEQQKKWKAAALDGYLAFSFLVGTSPGDSPDSLDRRRFTDVVTGELRKRPLGIVAELNGSARSLSVDKELLAELGVKTAFHNDKPGVFAHQILPEGAGLKDARELLERYHRMDRSFQIAYVPDNDGDRGNLVFYDAAVEKAVALDAQSVFALVVSIQLAWLRYIGVSGDRIAVVANGPTSLRIDRICSSFGARLFRAEVGEANVVSLAERLTGEGWTVAVLGEGSNGGNITPPATVRDPMSTLLALIKMHAFGLAAYVDDALNKESGFLDLLRRLPTFSTIATDDERAKLKVPDISHGELKTAYEENMEKTIQPLLTVLSREYGGSIAYRIINYEGTETMEGAGNRSSAARGGLKVVFSTEKREDVASLWMRGSGTEPVFRILADCYGTNETLLNELIQWQRAAVMKACGIGQ